MSFTRKITLGPNTTNGVKTSQVYGGGTGTIVVSGTFDGAMVQLQYAGLDGANFVNLPDGNFTASTAVEILIASGQLRVNVTNAGASTSVTVEVYEHEQNN